MLPHVGGWDTYDNYLGIHHDAANCSGWVAFPRDDGFSVDDIRGADVLYATANEYNVGYSVTWGIPRKDPRRELRSAAGRG